MTDLDQAERLRLARRRAGFREASDATERFGWKYPTYAAHENGSRGFKSRAAEYARAFKVDLSWLLTGQVAPAARETDGRVTGMTEPEVQALRPGQKHYPIDLDHAARILAPESSRPAFFLLSRDLPEMSLRSGDLLVCDLHPPTDPGPGSIVLVQIVDEATGAAETVARRLYPPYLTGDPAHNARPLRFDPVSMSIMGRVVASFRYCG
ncbi:LexA family transcriptional regulator [Rhodovulum sulfidophilum]|uniref:HTH cro/C1-type domain-containing protein n=1 Tax=Rhodovulum sulfidophilum TaxID=35806 RepID=A0ABS1RSI8_RHOSU|nr:hypothetical protein [Rhodovulum sulfidophilum]MBL3563269.1 hypothetical protein [Rhodovulum sulfidophilum]MBL3608996.1 hypothetical protein [Rhodovulum sulfidophilum]MCE8458788.1 hypothetical protein [Rhodovulum sulfidophilum]